MGHVVFWVSAERLFDAVQQTATLGQRHLQVLLEIKPALKKRKSKMLLDIKHRDISIRLGQLQKKTTGISDHFIKMTE